MSSHTRTGAARCHGWRRLGLASVPTPRCRLTPTGATTGARLPGVPLYSPWNRKIPRMLVHGHAFGALERQDQGELRSVTE